MQVRHHSCWSYQVGLCWGPSENTRLARVGGSWRKDAWLSVGSVRESGLSGAAPRWRISPSGIQHLVMTYFSRSVSVTGASPDFLRCCFPYQEWMCFHHPRNKENFCSDSKTLCNVFPSCLLFRFVPIQSVAFLSRASRSPSAIPAYHPHASHKFCTVCSLLPSSLISFFLWFVLVKIL